MLSSPRLRFKWLVGCCGNSDTGFISIVVIVQHYFKLKPLRDSRSVILLDEGYANWLWTHGYIMEDVAYGIALAVTDERATGRLYNITEPQTRTMLDFIHAIGEQLNWKGMIIQVPYGHLPDELGIPLHTEQNIIVESIRIREELGYREAFSFEEVQEIFRWNDLVR